MLWLQAQHKPDAVERPAKSVPVPEQTCFTPRQSDPDPAVSAAHEAEGDERSVLMWEECRSVPHAQTHAPEITIL